VAGSARALWAWETVSKRFARWQTDGTWARIEAALRTQAAAAGTLDGDAQVDSSVIWAPQHAAGARNGGFPRSRPAASKRWGGHRGGLTTKRHPIGDGRGRDLATRLTWADADTSRWSGWWVDRAGGRHC
jgi:hypothetical protein